MEILCKRRHIVVWGMVAWALVFLAGCGDGRPSRVSISGRVKIDGQPLKYGQIQFIPEQSRLSSGRLDSEGRFTLSCFEKGDGAVPGTHRVTVTAGEFVSSSKTLWHAPKKYADQNGSGLTQVVSEPTENLVINLTWEGKKPFIENHEPDSEELRP